MKFRRRHVGMVVVALLSAGAAPGVGSGGVRDFWGLYARRALSVMRPAGVWLALSLLAVAGCASSATTQSSAARDPKSRDTLDCLDQAREMSPGSPGLGGAGGPRLTINQDRYQTCMRERGHPANP
jgi:hypothetical protein